MKKTILALLTALCLPLAGGVVRAQSLRQSSDTLRHRPSHSIGFDLRPSYVFPTRSFFTGDNAAGKPINTALSAHLKYAFRFSPDSRLGRLYPYAYQGIGMAYNTFFNSSEVGTPVAVYAFQGSRIAKLAPGLTLDYEWNFGASFGWKRYNPETNYYNDVVGSRINAYINAGFFLNWQVAPQWSLTAGVDLTHYSNGNTNYPNSGVNTVGARIGLVRTFGDSAAEPATASVGKEEEPSSLAGRISYDVVLYGSTRRRGILLDNGPLLVPGSFGVAGLNFNPMYRVNRYFRAGVSVDAQYDESANLKDYHVEGTSGGDIKFYRPPFREQFAVGLSLRAELNMPIFSVNVGFGRNLIQQGEDTRGFYQILALKTFVTPRLFLHVGYQLHDFKDPNNLMLGLGWRFGKR